MIPKKIHYCWFGGNPIPDEFKEYMESWKEFCPDYEIIEWNESNYDIEKNQYIHEAYQSKRWAFVSDYARLDIIYNHGGIYFDVDVELVRNLDSLLINEAFAGFELGKSVNTGLGFGAIKEHATIKKLRDNYDKLKFINEDGSFNLTTCTIYQTDFLIKEGLKLNGKKQVVAGITIYPDEFFSPKPIRTYKTKLTPNSYSIHHYSASWFPEEQYKSLQLALKLKKFLPLFVAYKISALIIYTKYKGVRFTMRRVMDRLFGRQ